MGAYAREEGYLLWYSAEVYPTEEDGQNHTVIMQHALGNTVVYGLEGRRCGREEEEGREWKEEGGEGGEGEGRGKEARGLCSDNCSYIMRMHTYIHTHPHTPTHTHTLNSADIHVCTHPHTHVHTHSHTHTATHTHTHTHT